jgi:hypothetical protein
MATEWRVGENEVRLGHTGVSELFSGVEVGPNFHNGIQVKGSFFLADARGTAGCLAEADLSKKSKMDGRRMERSNSRGNFGRRGLVLRRKGPAAYQF